MEYLFLSMTSGQHQKGVTQLQLQPEPTGHASMFLCVITSPSFSLCNFEDRRRCTSAVASKSGHETECNAEVQTHFWRLLYGSVFFVTFSIRNTDMNTSRAHVRKKTLWRTVEEWSALQMPKRETC